MKKIALMLALVCSVAATQSFAQDKTKAKTTTTKTTASSSAKKEKCGEHDGCCKKGAKDKKAA